MKALVDTSVLIAAFVESHSEHESSLNCLAMLTGQETAYVSLPSLAEIYSVLTSLPLNPRISPSRASRLVEKNIYERFAIVEYSRDDYMELIQFCSNKGLAGGVTYDFLIGYAGIKENLDRLVTLNPSDFERCLSTFELSPYHPERVL